MKQSENKGANGRPPKYTGPTTVVRVPVAAIAEIEAVLKKYKAKKEAKKLGTVTKAK